jgi:hypothetical protein
MGAGSVPAVKWPGRGAGHPPPVYHPGREWVVAVLSTSILCPNRHVVGLNMALTVPRFADLGVYLT